MKRTYRTLAIALFLGATGAALAQAPSGGNAMHRNGGGNDPFSYYGPSQQPRDFRAGGQINSAIGRNQPRGHAAQVSPVPEPEQWAMMAAGLALVGFIVRRSRKRS